MCPMWAKVAWPLYIWMSWCHFLLFKSLKEGLWFRPRWHHPSTNRVNWCQGWYVILPLPPNTTPKSNYGAHSTLVIIRATFSMPLHLGTTTHAMGFAKSLRAIMESQQLAVLVNTYHIHFEQYSNGQKKKMTQIKSYAVWKKCICHLYVGLSQITIPYKRKNWRSIFKIDSRK